jgi:hypothetical protein
MTFRQTGATSLQVPDGFFSFDALPPHLCRIFASSPPVFAIPAHFRDPNRARIVHIWTILYLELGSEPFSARDGENMGDEKKMRQRFGEGFTAKKDLH